MTTPADLARELTGARDAFFRELGRVEPASLTTPGLVGEWSGRELIAHLGYWAGNAVEVLRLVETDRVDEVGAGLPPTDEVNATVARVARDTPLVAVRKREAGSVDALLERLATLDPALLAVVLPDGATWSRAFARTAPSTTVSTPMRFGRASRAAPVADSSRLLDELHASRASFSTALESVDPALLDAPGLVGDWSARELVAHLAHWNEWASTCLEAAAGEGLDGLVSGEWDVDAQNAEVAARAAGRSFTSIRDEERVAFERFAARLGSLDAALLEREAPWGGTVETIVRENGADHYAEHTQHLRAWSGVDEADEADDEADEEDRAPTGLP